MTQEDPFRVLGIAPTLDCAAIKRAYFAGLTLAPPHTDPEGFRRLRRAYEALQQPTAARRAWLAAPLDVAQELSAWDESFKARLERVSGAPQQVDPGQQIARLIEWLMDLRHADLQAACRAPASGQSVHERSHGSASAASEAGCEPTDGAVVAIDAAR